MGGSLAAPRAIAVLIVFALSCPMHFANSVVIHDLDLVGIPLLPEKADSPTIVDADAVLSFPVARKRVQAIPGRRPQIVELPGIVQNHQLCLRSALYLRRKLPASFAVRYRFGVGIPETPDRSSTIVRLTNGVKHYYESSSCGPHSRFRPRALAEQVRRSPLTGLTVRCRGLEGS